MGTSETELRRGAALREAGRSAEAIEVYRNAIAAGLESAPIYNDLGNAHAELGRVDAALAAYSKALELDPRLAEGHFNLAMLVQAGGDSQRAALHYRAAISAQPDFFDAYFNLAFILMIEGDSAGALDCYAKCVALRPDVPEARLNYAMLLLQRGDFARGWHEYEWRRRIPAAPPTPALAQPEWDGSPPAGKTILLYVEQGFGDAIQFIRYASLLARQGARVLVQCTRELQVLLATAPGVVRCIAAHEPLPPFDFHFPLLSLPRIFTTDTGDIPATVPYLGVDPDAEKAWRLRSPPGGLRVGLAWAAQSSNPSSKSRSCPLRTFALLAQLDGVRFHSLQKGEASAELRDAAGLRVVDDTAQLGDFAATAALIAGLDLVITVDTAVAHVAGALGKPVWTLIPFAADWRWLEDREDSPWYPTMRLFRQRRPGDWAEVLQRVAAELRWLAQQPADPAQRQALAVEETNLGNAQRERGRLEDAATSYRRALSIAPDYAPALYNLGLVLREMARPAEAERCFRRARELDPALPPARVAPDILYAEAVALQDAGKPGEARRLYAELLQAEPSHAKAHNNLGALLHREGDLEGAIGHYERAFQANPELFDAARNLAIAWLARGELAKAEGFAERALALDPAAPDAKQLLADILVDVGAAHSFSGEHRAAIACFERSIVLEPQSARAHFNLALERLSVGDYARGWPEYEWRWRLPEFPGRRLDSPRPQWDGGAPAGKTLLLYAEQGMGNAIQFVRYARPLASRGAKVLVRCPPALVPLLRHAAGVSGASSDEDPALPEFDASCPFLSLPLAFGTTRESIPRELPYLQVPESKRLEWRDRLAGEGLRVGLVWGSYSGNAELVQRKSIPLRRFAALAGVRPGLRFFSLQKGPHQAELASAPPGLTLTDLAPHLADFLDTAAAIAGLDLVITVDTAVAHLAGALAKPVWTLVSLPLDWRWAGEAGGAWYPGMRIIRQPAHGDWEAVLGEVAAALADLR